MIKLLIPSKGTPKSNDNVIHNTSLSTFSRQIWSVLQRPKIKCFIIFIDKTNI